MQAASYVLLELGPQKTILDDIACREGMKIILFEKRMRLILRKKRCIEKGGVE